MSGETLSVSGPESRYAGGFLTVDLDALRQNYTALARVCQPVLDPIQSRIGCSSLV